MSNHATPKPQSPEQAKRVALFQAYLALSKDARTADACGCPTLAAWCRMEAERMLTASRSTLPPEV